jgi:preprotein translocase subunit SecA
MAHDASIPASSKAIALSASVAAQWRAMSHEARLPRTPRGLDRLHLTIEELCQRLVPRRRQSLRFAQQVVAMEPRFRDMTDEQLGEAAGRMREMIRLDRATREQMVEAMAIVCEAAARTLRMRPYPVQIAGAFVIHCGGIAEMATGEGKTLVAGLAATLAGWRGQGCHVITVNDYLAKRDAEVVGPLLAFCGLSVAVIQERMSQAQRRAAYAADVTYATNKEVTADFLRDRLVLGRRRSLASALTAKMAGRETDRAQHVVMRGLACAIVDEADSVLIDEAVTPLIISADGENAEESLAYEQAAGLAAELEPGTDYLVDRANREVTLTARGRGRIDELAEGLGGVWAGRRRRLELATQAVQVRELFLRGQHYIVDGGKVVIVDEFTGRLMPDRTWRAGVHQAVEAKEGLAIQPAKQTLARLSFQRFYRMYPKLGGMTGTAREARGELWRTYRLPVVAIPTHRPSRRRVDREQLHPTAFARWVAVMAEIRRVRETGRSVLVGTRSVEASEQLGAMLTKAGLEHQVLNAVRHAEEAAIVARAGEPGRITVATNMAGRGTDIKLHPEVAAAGGLAVIATERHESPRVDRQLIGRCGRQGDAGSAVVIMSCEDELLRRYAPGWVMGLLRVCAKRSRGGAVARWLLGYVQKRAAGAAARQRRSVVRQDEELDEQLGFAGDQ